VRAASIASILLATDTLFLMTDLFDGGPVALQHVLLIGGLLAVQIWLATGSRGMLRLGFFLWGLGMWDKALMVWPLSGLGLAALVVFPRRTLMQVRKGLGSAAIFFLLGALPLVWYNVAQRGVTATANTKYDAAGIGEKIPALKRTFDGSMLSGYMVYNDAKGFPRKPKTVVEIASVAVRGLIGDHRTNWMLPAYLLGMALLILLWRTEARRPLLLLLIACAVMWFQMALNRGTGGSAHHVILMWPFPVVFLAIAFDAAARRFGERGGRVLAAAVAVLALQNVLTTNDYLARFTLFGGAGGWTDALYPLSQAMDEMPASWVGTVDWGYLNGLRLLEKRPLKIFMPDPDVKNPSFLVQLKAPDFLFVQHPDDKEILRGVNGNLRKAAEQLGYEEKVERVIFDRNGRPVFQIFRFRRRSGGG
jgi:hypothetical protein